MYIARVLYLLLLDVCVSLVLSSCLSFVIYSFVVLACFSSLCRLGVRSFLGTHVCSLCVSRSLVCLFRFVFIYVLRPCLFLFVTSLFIYFVV